MKREEMVESCFMQQRLQSLQRCILCPTIHHSGTDQCGEQGQHDEEDYDEDDREILVVGSKLYDDDAS